jgi:hypothetical protein
MQRSGEDASGQLDTVKIRPFHRDDLDEVIRLWSLCRLTRPWNDPQRKQVHATSPIRHTCRGARIQREVTVRPPTVKPVCAA